MPLEFFILRAWGRAAGSGSGYVYEIRISDISAGQCMFRRYVFFTAKIWITRKVETGSSLYRKERTPAENRTAASSEETAGFFTENVVP